MNTFFLAHAIPSYVTAALVAALISGTVTIIGYWQTSRLKRQDRQRQLLARALKSVAEYREFAYKIRRRSHENDRNVITDALSEVQAQLNLHMATLEIEAPRVATHYKHLVAETKRIVGPQIAAGWDQAPPTTDDDMHVRDVDLTELETPNAAFINAARKHLHGRLWSFWQYRRIPVRCHPDKPASQSLQQANSQKLNSTGKVIECGNGLTSDPMKDDKTNNSSNWELIRILFGWSGVAVFVITSILGICFSMLDQERLLNALRDLITPATVLFSSTLVVSTWVAGSPRSPQPGEIARDTRDLFGTVVVFSYFAVAGIIIVIGLQALPSTTPIWMLHLLGGLALGLMGLVMVGLVKLLDKTHDSVSICLRRTGNDSTSGTVDS
ncbi:MAG: hypothetical protein OXI96_03515 [Acidimicrobiaceae bacterium]|nr:hypothetical protein [Acidimicrobiaceae bacterium]